MVDYIKKPWKNIPRLFLLHMAIGKELVGPKWRESHYINIPPVSQTFRLTKCQNLGNSWNWKLPWFCTFCLKILHQRTFWKIPNCEFPRLKIVSASRSPPGQVSKRLDFWSSFSQSWGLWYNFWFIFRSLGTLWERWGPILVSKNGLGHQRCPRRRHPENKVTFWDWFGSQFLNIFRFFGVCF